MSVFIVDKFRELIVGFGVTDLSTWGCTTTPTLRSIIRALYSVIQT